MVGSVAGAEGGGDVGVEGGNVFGREGFGNDNGVPVVGQSELSQGSLVLFRGYLE